LNGSTFRQYIIDRADNISFTNPIYQYTSNSSPFTVSSLENNKQYYFRVFTESINAGTSVASVVRNQTTFDFPGQPPGLTVTTTGNGRVDLSWNIPSDGGTAILEYDVSNIPMGGSITYPTQDRTRRSATIDGLTNINYTFYVRAKNAVGYGSYSTQSGTPFTTPSPPTLNTPTRNSVGSITLTWNSALLNGSTFSKYRIARRQDGQSTWTSFDSTTTSITFSGLLNGTRYYFEVYTVSTNAGESTTPSTINEITFSVPDPPTSLSATPRNGRIDLSWNAPSNTGGTPIRDYEIRRNTNPVVTLTTTNRFAIITGLTNSITYSFDVRARNDVGYSSYSDISSSAKPFTIPGAPRNVNATAGNAQATINWTAPNITSTFTINGSSTFIAPMSGTVEVLIVGGGGGGGRHIGGGGGGGGVIYMPSVSVTMGTSYSVVVGSGGAPSSNGQASSVFGAIAAGGGSSDPWPIGSGKPGGSGGGAPATNATNQGGVLNQGGDSSGNSLGMLNEINNVGTIYGNRGGNITVLRSGTPTRAAGGGGAGGQGADTPGNLVGNVDNILGNTGQTGAGSGGVGIHNPILGPNYYWGGGGGGGSYHEQIGGWGGLGGGGGGSGRQIWTGAPGGGEALNPGANGGPGAEGGDGGANTGGGGGGGQFNYSGGRGGSGIVVIRYINGVDTTITSYTVTSSPGGQQIVITNRLTTTATFSGLTNDTAYTFTVVAKNSDDGISPLSTISATPISATVPTKPLNLTGTPGVGFVDLSWNAPSSDGGSNIISYTIQTSTNQSLWTDSSSHFSERFKRISNLANGVLHYFRVYAINLVGNSPVSDLFSTTPIVFFTLNVTQNFVGGRLDISNNYTQSDISFNWYSSIDNSFTSPILLSNLNNRKYLFIRLEYQKLYIRCTINYNTNTFTTSSALIPEKYNPQLFDYNINIYTVGQKQALFNTATYNYSNANIPPVFNIELNLTQLSTFLSDSRSITSASNSSINTNAFETSMRPFGERLLEIIAVKIFGHPKTRAAISNDNSFYNTTQISTEIYNTFNNHRNELGNYFMGLYDITQVNNNAQLINVSNLNIIFPFFFKGTTQKNAINLFRNGPNVGGSLLVNGNYNIPLLLTFN
jgi:hypothetical protein